MVDGQHVWSLSLLSDVADVLVLTLQLWPHLDEMGKHTAA